MNSVWNVYKDFNFSAIETEIKSAFIGGITLLLNVYLE